MFYQVSLLDTPNATSLLESADGAMRSGSQDGQTTSQSGPAPALVNLSARQAKGKGLLTSATFGLPSFGSSTSADLQRSLASRLREKLGETGSQGFDLTWSQWDMLQGPPISRLRASALPTYVSAYGGVPPTVTARDYRSGMSMELLSKRLSHPRGVNLNEFMQRALGRPGKLNPRFLCLWMGYRAEWDLLGAMAMRSFRNSRRSS